MAKNGTEFRSWLLFLHSLGELSAKVLDACDHL
jgi:hypothetical protein